MFLSLKTLYRKRTVIWPFYFYTIIRTLSLSFDIPTNKKNITAQEIDYKVRNYLLKHKNLYEFNSSPYETGYIKFIEGSGHSFWYDLMPESGKKFYPTKYLLIYNDNKTVESKSINVEVHLTKK